MYVCIWPPCTCDVHSPHEGWPLSTLTLFISWQERHHCLQKHLCLLFLEVVFQNEWKKRMKGKSSNSGWRRKQPLKTEVLDMVAMVSFWWPSRLVCFGGMWFVGLCCFSEATCCTFMGCWVLLTDVATSLSLCVFMYLSVWCNGYVIYRINEITLRLAWLVLGWVTIFGLVYHVGMDTSQIGQLSFASLHTHTHNRFTALLEYVRDHPGEQVPER